MALKIDSQSYDNGRRTLLISLPNGDEFEAYINPEGDFNLSCYSTRHQVLNDGSCRECNFDPEDSAEALLAILNWIEALHA